MNQRILTWLGSYRKVTSRDVFLLKPVLCPVLGYIRTKEGPHLRLSRWDRASSTCWAVLRGSEMESRIRFSWASRARIRGPKLAPEVSGVVGVVGKVGEILFRARLMFCLWLSRVKKQDGHDSHVGKESQWPRLQESQRDPVTPGRQEHTPVSLLQPSGRVPSRLHRQAGKEQNLGKCSGL